MAETVKGLNELLKNFDNLKDLDLVSALKAGGNVIMAQAIDNSSHNTPNVVTGNYMGSWNLQENNDGGISLVNSADYSYYLEYTVGGNGFGVARRAIDEKTNEAVSKIGQNLNKQMESLGR